MVRASLAVLLLCLGGCVEGSSGEPVGMTHLTASRTWDAAHAELFDAHAKGARGRGEILWPSQVRGGPPPFVILVAGASNRGTTTLALKLAESGFATLRYSDRTAVDGHVVSASVEVLRRDSRVGRIVVLGDDESADRLGDAKGVVRVVVPGEAASSEVIATLSTSSRP
ncbi:hypothetical protein BH11MYX4_BH11MYX4_43710 [soil metagenome]